MPSPELWAKLASHFRQPPRLFSAPGRINLIGEHTDYNDGFVLPVAIDRRTFVAGAPRSDRVISVRSLNTDTAFSFDLDNPGPPRRGTWLDYVEGTAQAMIGRGLGVCGADLVLYSDVPTGAGLSSSAALEVAVAYAIARLAGTDAPSLAELALSGQSAEHLYVGTLCGIMDQFISALAQPGCALLIDCRSLMATPVPLALGQACLLICDTRVKHELASSAYNERRAECVSGVAYLQAAMPNVRSLRDVSEERFAECASALPEPIRQRCRHVVTENARTLRAAAALTTGELAHFGQLMIESHQSLRDDYEVSCPELDEAVDTACKASGVYGSRMTGGGFGGCTVSLVERAAAEDVAAAIRVRFAERFGREPHLHTTSACAGVCEHFA